MRASGKFDRWAAEVGLRSTHRRSPRSPSTVLGEIEVRSICDPPEVKSTIDKACTERGKKLQEAIPAQFKTAAALERLAAEHLD